MPFYYKIIKYAFLFNMWGFGGRHGLCCDTFFFFENRAVTFDCEYFKNYFSLNYP